MFKQLPEKLNYPEIEKNILKFWENYKIFDKTLENRKNNENYSFYEGPPTVNGKPGIHHLMARTIKDTICRYKTQTGHYVRRQAGWDTHGLPVELAMEKELGLKEKKEIEVYGIKEFNKKCEEFVYKNIEMDHGWGFLTERMGYWVDLSAAYITCTQGYVESVWWALKQFFLKGLIYRGFKVIPQSPTIATPLSSHELSLGYKEVKDPNCYLKLTVTKFSENLADILKKLNLINEKSEKIDEKFDKVNEKLEKTNENSIKLLVWTTTPWTLFANVALAVGNDYDYVLVKNTVKSKDGEIAVNKLILVESRLSALDGETEILAKFKGSDLIGTNYEQILPYCKIDSEKFPDSLAILPGDFVTVSDGSGIVHLAPAFGEDDYQMSLKFKIPFLQPVTPNGHFTDEVGEFSGRAIKTFKYDDRTEEGVDKDVIIWLKTNDKIYRCTNDYLHNYPHCWRTGNPIMYYARESWFIRSTEYKNTMIELNKTINWQPKEIGEGRFGNWLEEVKDWALSRDRYWGTPLPIWINEDDKDDMFAVGSIEELKEGLYEFCDSNEDNCNCNNNCKENNNSEYNSSNSKENNEKNIKNHNNSGKIKRIPVTECGIEIDLHRPFVDNVIFERNGKIYRRTREVIDVWFDSGAMPFAQLHYPFENKELFEKQFPCDFVAEGIDQTRGWFYTLHNIASALFAKPAFKNIVVNELILDKKGVKMSKSLGNTVDPFEIMEKYGADATRWYLLSSTPPWRTTLFNEDDIAKTVISDFFRSLTNTYAFFALYANIDKFDGSEQLIPHSERPEIDKWIISKLNSLISDYRKFMDDYDLTKSCRAVQNFVINELSNWYIRRNRRRFWKGEKDSDKIAAYQTLWEVLVKITSLIAPVAPFLAEDLYLRLQKYDLEALEITKVTDFNDNSNENNDTVTNNLNNSIFNSTVKNFSENIRNFSVHIADMPTVETEKIALDLERRMELAQKLVSLARFLREKSKLRIRQPLRRILVPVNSPSERRDIQAVAEIIKEELNIKEIEFVSDETSNIISKVAKGNFKTLGKKFGKQTQQVADAIKLLTNEQVKELERNKKYILNIQGNDFTVALEDVEISSNDIEGWLVATDSGVTVALDTTLDADLINEGIAREFISKVQNLRKDSGFEVTDRICIEVACDLSVKSAILAKQEHINSETLCDNFAFLSELSSEYELDFFESSIFIRIFRQQ